MLFLVGGEPLFDKALGTAGLALTGAGFFVPIRKPVCVECVVAYACAKEVGNIHGCGDALQYAAGYGEPWHVAVDAACVACNAVEIASQSGEFGLPFRAAVYFVICEHFADFLSALDCFDSWYLTDCAKE